MLSSLSSLSSSSLLLLVVVVVVLITDITGATTNENININNNNNNNNNNNEEIKEELVFLSFGDWGINNENQTKVANQMGIYAESYDASFVIALGDNFYQYGVKNDTDKQWDLTYQNVYTAESLQIDWYALLGNHDYRQSPQSQIDYDLNERDERWNMPNYYYNFRKYLNATCQEIYDDNNDNDNNEEDNIDLDDHYCKYIEFVIIDTQLLTPPVEYVKTHHGSNETYVYIEYEIEGNATLRREEHWNWVKETLEAASGASGASSASASSENNNRAADWIIVAGHYPVFSNGYHGDTDYLKENIQPLFEEYMVDLYLCGHDHSLQHFSNNHVEYFVNGNAAKADYLLTYDRSDTDPNVKENFEKVDPGFMLHSISSDGLRLTTLLVDGDGNELYSFEQISRKHYIPPDEEGGGPSKDDIDPKDVATSYVGIEAILGIIFGCLCVLFLFFGLGKKIKKHRQERGTNNNNNHNNTDDSQVMVNDDSMGDNKNEEDIELTENV